MWNDKVGDVGEKELVGSKYLCIPGFSKLQGSGKIVRSINTYGS